MSTLLINESPLQVLPTLACAIGLNEAIALQQIHYWLERSENERDGEKWVYKTMRDWHKEFCFWSLKTLQRVFDELEDTGLLVSTDIYNKKGSDRTKWYRIDRVVLKVIETGEFDPNDWFVSDLQLVKMTNSLSQNDDMQLVKLTNSNNNVFTETTTEITKDSGEPPNGKVKTPEQIERGLFFEAVLKHAFRITYIPKMRLAKETVGRVNTLVKALEASGITRAQYIAYAEDYKCKNPDLTAVQSSAKLPLEVLAYLEANPLKPVTPPRLAPPEPERLPLTPEQKAELARKLREHRPHMFKQSGDNK